MSHWVSHSPTSVVQCYLLFSVSLKKSSCPNSKTNQYLLHPLLSEVFVILTYILNLLALIFTTFIHYTTTGYEEYSGSLAGFAGPHVVTVAKR